MTREEIIRNLKYTMEKHKNDNVPTFGTDISLMCKDILNYLEQEPCEDAVSRKEVIDILDNYDGLDNTIEEFIDSLKNIYEALPPVTPTQRWIPVSERFPEEEGLYLVSVNNEHNRRYSKTCWFYGKDYWFSRQDVIAWMPLPKPYKENADGSN